MAAVITSTIKLASGYEIPRLGFGVGSLSNVIILLGTSPFAPSRTDMILPSPPEETERCCLEALKAGYCHLDSAAVYLNEAGCGSAIRASSIPREQIFFTSKVFDISYYQAKAQIDASLAESGLDYIDLMLLHKPMGGSENRKGAWKALVEAAEAGKVRSIGVSNYGVHHLKELEQHIGELEAERGGKGKGGIISINQVELHPWLGRKDIVDWCTQRGIAIEAYCPVVRGTRFEEPSVKKLADKYNKTPAQILIRWSLDKGFIPLPKSVTPLRISENAGVFDFNLTPEEVRELETDEYSPAASWDPTVMKLEE
ncbi:oxidoreductase [Penicillium daleae]|uniref:D-xylose reductase [NAD(P)H] n=1 Tax=Penicillium daleae TaxID=63821 RepID=A0AAD6CH69_9EURO|nr:oxidoreductase [Penicillium daleae]KAJ5465303.1 oxidoreductase [Penicillium daleae]